jgi:hypothetical protein
MYCYALDKKTGKTRWKVDRDEPSSWATPFVVEHDGRKQVIASGQNFARGYDLATGKEIWCCSGQTDRPVASPVAGHGMVFIGSGYRGSFLGAFRLGGKGDIEDTEHVAWSIPRHTPDVPSPVLSGKRLYFHSGRGGILSCRDAVSGKPHYEASRIDGRKSVTDRRRWSRLPDRPRRHDRRHQGRGHRGKSRNRIGFGFGRGLGTGSLSVRKGACPRSR